MSSVNPNLNFHGKFLFGLNLSRSKGFNSFHLLPKLFDWIIFITSCYLSLFVVSLLSRVMSKMIRVLEMLPKCVVMPLGQFNGFSESFLYHFLGFENIKLPHQNSEGKHINITQLFFFVFSLFGLQ
jgi:hypothetical protein